MWATITKGSHDMRESSQALPYQVHTNGSAHGPHSALEKLVDANADRLTVLRELLGEAACRQLGIYPIPEGTKLWVVIPVYNERRWIAEVVRRVKAVPIPKEIILVDDASTDGTREVLQILADGEVRVFLQPRNQGKGAALREGFRHCTGTI